MTFQKYHRIGVRAQEVHQFPDMEDVDVAQVARSGIRYSTKHALDSPILG